MVRKTATKHWLNTPALSWHKAFLLGAGCWVLLLTAAQLGAGDSLLDRIIYPVEFQLRSKLGWEPKLDPRIKIYAIDQRVLSSTRSEGLSSSDWAALYQSLSLAQPFAIVTDKTFSIPLSQDSDATRRLAQAIGASRTIAGAFVFPAEVEGLPAIPLGNVPQALSGPGKTPFKHVYAHGPEPSLFGSFWKVGHIDSEDHGYIKPFIEVDLGESLPFLGFAIDPSLRIANGALRSDAGEIPVDGHGRVLLNLGPEREYRSQTVSLIRVLEKARLGQPIKSVHPGDIVLILTKMAIGTAYTDVETPMGRLPGGYLVATAISSMITAKWLKPVPGEWLAILVLSFIGAILARGLRPLSFWVSLLLLESMLCVAGFLSFGLGGLLLPWPLPAVALFMSGVIGFAEKTRVSDRKSRTLRLSMEGLLGAQKLRSWLSTRETLRIAPSNQVMTFMFIDLVGFSIRTEELSPEDAFRDLRQLLGLMSAIVHEEGGIIDKSLGDGLLCYFGFRSSDEQEDAHALGAVKCALRVQTEVLEKMLQTPLTEGRIYPLRIGVNTAEAYVGDLGGNDRVDFTVIGHGVNLAQRFESACEPYHILCGASTQDRLKGTWAADLNWVKKKIPIKHHESLSLAFECDPFEKNPDAKQLAMARYREASTYHRGEDRFPIGNPERVEIASPEGQGRLIDFSLSGLGVELDTYYGKGVILRLSLSFADAGLQKRLVAAGLTSLTCEVKWSRPQGSAYRHGLLIRNLNLAERTELLRACRSLPAPVSTGSAVAS